MIPIYIVDAFTIGNNQPFTGNSAAVCLLEYDDDITDEIKQKIATEMNFSETAFVSKGWNRTESINMLSQTRTIRWFSPVHEVQLCGHATLASANVLFEREKHLNIEENAIVFDTKFKGILNASINSNTQLITLNFPIDIPKILNKNQYQWIDAIAIATLGPMIPLTDVKEVYYGPKTKKLLIRLSDTKTLADRRLANVMPNYKEMVNIDTNILIRGIIVTEKGNFNDERVHFYSRYFSPWNGINEDPVTGSAHTVLAPYWEWNYKSDELINGKEMIGKQCYPSRGGIILTQVCDDRVKLSGSSRIIVNGNFCKI